MFQRGRSISQHQRSFLLHIWTTTRTFHCGDQSLSLLFVFALANYMEVWLYVWIFKLTRTFLWWSLRWLFWGLLHILFLSLTRTLVLSGDLIYIDNLKKDLLHVWFLVRVVEFILSGILVEIFVARTGEFIHLVLIWTRAMRFLERDILHLLDIKSFNRR